MTHAFRSQMVSADDTGEIQLLRALGYASEELDKVMRVQQHGFTSNPPADSHGIIIPLRGQRILAAAFGYEHQDYRQKNLPPGTAVQYDDKQNCLRAYGDEGIQIETKSGHIWAKPVDGKNIYLGGKPGDSGVTFKRVMLEDGSFSPNVYAKAP